jgi:hypothetical protein
MRGPAYRMIWVNCLYISAVKQFVRHNPHTGFVDPLYEHMLIRSRAYRIKAPQSAQIPLAE